MKLAVVLRLRRVVAEQVVEARVANDLRETLGERVAVDDRAAVGLLGQHAQRVLRHLQHPGVGRKAGRRAEGHIVDLKFEWREPSRIERVDGRVVPVRVLIDLTQPHHDVGLLEPFGGALAIAVLGAGRNRGLARIDRLRGVRAIHLRRQQRGKPLADEDDRLTPFAQRAEPDRQRLQRAHDDVVADALDVLRRQPRVVLLVDIARRVVVLAPFEPLDGADDRRMVVGEQQIADRRQRVHDRDQIVRPQLRLDELHDRIPDGHARRPPDVIVIQQECINAHVVAPRLGLFVLPIPDDTRRGVARPRYAVDLDRAELLDRLHLAVFDHLEVVLGQVGDRRIIPVGDDDVHPDEVDAGLERRLRIRRGRLRRGCGILCGADLKEGGQQDDESGNARFEHHGCAFSR